MVIRKVLKILEMPKEVVTWYNFQTKIVETKTKVRAELDDNSVRVVLIVKKVSTTYFDDELIFE